MIQGSARHAGVLALLLLLIGCLPAAAAVPLHGAWRAHAADISADVVRDDPQRADLHAFDPAVRRVFEREAGGVWIRLTPASGHWPQGPLVLSLPAPPAGGFELFQPGRDAPIRNSTDDFSRGRLIGHGRIGFLLDENLSAEQPLLLRLLPYPSRSTPVHVEVLPLADYLRVDARWLMFMSACTAFMLAMSLIALFFASLLRDAAFLYYAVYVLAYAAMQAMQSGFAFHPLELTFLAAHAPVWGRTFIGLSTLFAALFLVRFANLRRYAPKGGWLVLGLGAALAACLTVLLLLDSGPLFALARALAPLLLILAAPVMLLVSAVAFRRGSRYAGFFLFGWTPLLVMTALYSAQVNFGRLLDWTWIIDVTTLAAVFETLVLSIGLADRALVGQRDREHMRRLADVDPLTGVLNRRAWQEQTELVLGRAGGRAAAAMLFIDVDDFKSLNDTYGHSAGDAALRAIADRLRRNLRPGDLVGRYGGEEFIVTLPRADARGAQAIAERIRVDVERAAIAVAPDDRIATLSVGIALQRPRESVEALTARADRAMYAAKAGGRNRSVFGGPDPAGAAFDGPD